MEVGASAIRDGKPVAELDSVYHDAAAITRRAQDAVVDRSADDAHKGSVIAALLMTASVAEIRQMVARAKKLLAEAVEAPGEGH